MKTKLSGIIGIVLIIGILMVFTSCSDFNNKNSLGSRSGTSDNSNGISGGKVDVGNDWGQEVNGIFVPGFSVVAKSIVNNETLFTFGRYSNKNLTLIKVQKTGFDQSDKHMQYECEMTYENKSGKYKCIGVVEFVRTSSSGWYMNKAGITGISSDFPDMLEDGDTGFPYLWFGPYHRTTGKSIDPSHDIGFSNGTPGTIRIENKRGNTTKTGEYICSPSNVSSFDFEMRICWENGLCSTWYGNTTHDKNVLTLFEPGMDGEGYAEMGTYVYGSYRGDW